MKFKVMTWNVENLSRPGERGGASEDVYRLKLGGLASVIRTLDPDVLALQEIWSADVLSDLQSALSGAYPRAALSQKPDRRGLRVAFLAKRELSQAQDLVDYSPNAGLAIRDVQGEPVTRMRRGALAVQVRTSDLRVSIINAHFKSKLLTFPLPRGKVAFTTDDEQRRAQAASVALAERTAEAFTLRNVALARLTSSEREGVIVLGDLGDGPDAASTEALYGQPGSQPGAEGFSLGERNGRARLFNLAGLIAAERRYSRVTQGKRELIDHILVSSHLLARGPDGALKLPSVAAHPDIQGAPLESVGEDPEVRRGSTTSDHAPVCAEFDW